MKTKTLTNIALMAALICLATMIIKIPTVNGYIHLGDSMIFLAVIILGKRHAPLAAGIGAALADLFGMYPAWIIPTFIIKFAMAFLMGFIVEDVMKNQKYAWVIGAFLGGILQIIGYAVATALMYGVAGMFAEIVGNVIQSGSSIVIAGFLIVTFNSAKTHIHVKK